MFTAAGRQFETVAIARLVILFGWTFVPSAAATPDQWGNPRGGCTWLVQRAPEPLTDPETGEVDFWDDPELPIVECGAELAYSDDGWRCAAGHEHTSIEARHAQGWDYAADAYDAAVIGFYGGREARPMGPTTHIDPAEVAHAVAALR